MKRLGFGMMRLPLTDPKVQGSVDRETVCKMVGEPAPQGELYSDG